MSAPSDLLFTSPARRSAAPAGPIALTIGATGEEALLGSSALLALAAAQPATAPPPPVPKVRINPTKRTLKFVVPVTDGPAYLGDVDLAVAPDDSLSVAAPRMLQMLEPILKPEVFARLKTAVGAAPMITQAQLAAETIGLSYDSDKLALAVLIPVPVRRTNRLKLRRGPDPNVPTLDPAAVSAFVNIRSAVDFVERGSDQGLAGPVSQIDGALRALGVVAEGEGFVSFRKGDPLFRRTGTRLIYDDLGDTIRWTLGDLLPVGRSFQGTPTIAGLSVARFYNVLEPTREIRSTGEQSFTIFSPSTVETIINGRTVERKLLQPGSYDLSDFPLAEGANNVELQIEDQTGARRTLQFDLYSNRQLMDPGLTEFSAYAGVYAIPTLSGLDYSRQWTSAGFVRRGMSERLTAGVNYQADAKAQQVGTELLWGSPIGLVGFDLATSHRSDGAEGVAAAATYERLVGGSTDHPQSIHAAVEWRSASFAVPGELPTTESVALRVSGGYSLTLGRDTYLAVDAQYARDRMPRVTSYAVRATGGLRLRDDLALVAEADWIHDRVNGEKVIRIGIRKRFGQRATGEADVDTGGGLRSTFQDSGGAGVGSWSANADVDRDDSGTSVNANATLETNRVEVGISQIAAAEAGSMRIDNVRTSFRAATSIAFADGAVSIGRPVQDSFLIAEPHLSLHGKEVLVDPQQKSEDAHSGPLGGAVDGTLSAYSPRLVIYNVPDAPPGYDIGQGNVQVVPPYHGGYKLIVGSDYHLLVIGRLLDRNGEPISLLAGKAIDLRAPKRPAITMFTSRDGKFGAQGLRPGKWRIEMPTEGGPTIYEIDVKDDPSGTVRLGDIRPVAQERGVR